MKFFSYVPIFYKDKDNGLNTYHTKPCLIKYGS